MKMKKTFSAMFVILTASVLLATCMSVASAGDFTQVTGTIVITGATSSPNPSGKSDNSVLLLESTGRFTGGIGGSFTGDARWIGHNIDNPETRTRNTHNVVTFSSATVMGKTGGLTIMTVGKVDGGIWVILGGSGELAGLNGHGTYTQTGAMMGVVSNYVGEIHFDP